jgi:hypothetical protein
MENMDKGLTVPKWGLILSLAENTPNAREFIFYEKKASLGVRNPCPVLFMSCLKN